MSDAYHATVEMHEAKWTDKEGSTITFKLPMKLTDDQRNPFHKFTKRRKGRAGTRFMLVCVDKKLKQKVYEDEVMLAGWNDSQTNGHTVKFWIATDTLGHPFEGFERHEPGRFYISMVELDDDQEPVNQKMRDKVESASKRPSERVSFSAAMLCKDDDFLVWINEKHGSHWSDPVVTNETDARDYLCQSLGIESRADLDIDPQAAQRFHEDIRRPFLVWKGEY